MSENRILTIALLLTVAAAVAVATEQARRRLGIADTTAADIEAQIDALDPATRAAVIARLGVDAAKAVRAHA
jgi:hypothetical protein